MGLIRSQGDFMTATPQLDQSVDESDYVPRHAVAEANEPAPSVSAEAGDAPAVPERKRKWLGRRGAESA